MSKSIHFTLMILALGCSSPKLNSLDFVETTILKPEAKNFDAVRLKGQVLNLGTTPNGECGFIWSYDRATVEDIKSDTQQILLTIPAVGSLGMFEAPLGGLERGRSIYIRTFVTVRDENAGERSVYSAKTESFDIGEIVANTGAPLISNNSAVVFGQLRGVFASGKSVEEHGHVISKNNPVPAIGCADCSTSTKGSSNDDEVFHSEFGGFEFNTTYRFRSYAISSGDTFYSKTVDTFRVRDGWELSASFPYTYAEGTAVVLNGNAYAGFGCKKALGCLQGDLVTDFWKFDPAAQNGFGGWSATLPLHPSITKQYNAVSFALGSKVYANFGQYYDQGGNNYVLANLLYLDPVVPAWGQYFTDSVFNMGRTGAVAFTLKGKAYMGAGRTDGFLELNDFWEYDPAAPIKWRPVASLPLQRAPSMPIEPNSGRYEAVAFTVQDEFAYVGAGQFGNIGLKDFWRFYPPDNNYPLGRWEQVASLPADAPGRYQAVAMSIGDKGYVGTGYSPTDGYLKDWWQYSPSANSWLARTPLPAPARTNAMGFAIGARGYLGTGHTKILIDGGLSSTEITLNDFWRYVPEK